jgi:CYTH domain-containing protein
MEIERKFLVDRLPNGFDPVESRRIDQGYLALDQRSGAEVRLRRHGDELSLTVKGAGSLSRVEVGLGIPSADFDSLWPLTEGRRLHKRRHVLPHGDHKVELDVYQGDLEGLVVAEIEFGSEDEARDFDPPEWIGKEVTGDERYLNETLATRGAPQ